MSKTDKSETLWESLQERQELSERFREAMRGTHLSTTNIISILLAWMPVDRLRECVELQESKKGPRITNH